MLIDQKHVFDTVVASPTVVTSDHEKSSTEHINTNSRLILSPTHSQTDSLSDMTSEKETKVDSSSSSTASKDLVKERADELKATIIDNKVKNLFQDDNEKRTALIDIIANTETLDEQAKSRRDSLAQHQGMSGVSWNKLNIASWLKDEVMFNKLNSAINLRLQQHEYNAKDVDQDSHDGKSHGSEIEPESESKKSDTVIEGSNKNKETANDTDKAATKYIKPALPSAVSKDIRKKNFVAQASYLPTLEKQYCKDYSCCGLLLPSLHDLLEHYEKVHISSTPANVISNYHTLHNSLHLNNTHSTITSLGNNNSSNSPQTLRNLQKLGNDNVINKSNGNMVQKPTRNSKLLQHQQKLQQLQNQKNLLVQHGPLSDSVTQQQQQQQQQQQFGKGVQVRNNTETQLQSQLIQAQQKKFRDMESSKHLAAAASSSRQQSQVLAHKNATGLNDNLVDAVPTTDVFLNQDKNLKQNQEQNQIDLKNAFKNYTAISNNLNGRSGQANDPLDKSFQKGIPGYSNKKKENHSQNETPTKPQDASLGNTTVSALQEGQQELKGHSLSPHVLQAHHSNIFKKPSSVSPLNVSDKAKDYLIHEVNVNKSTSDASNKISANLPVPTENDTEHGQINPTSPLMHAHMVNPNAIKLEQQQISRADSNEDSVSSGSYRVNMKSKNAVPHSSNPLGMKKHKSFAVNQKLLNATQALSVNSEIGDLGLVSKSFNGDTSNYNDPSPGIESLDHTSSGKTNLLVRSASISVVSHAADVLEQDKPRSRASSITSSMRSIHSDDQELSEFTGGSLQSNNNRIRSQSAGSSPNASIKFGSMSRDGYVGDKPFLNEHAKRMYLLELEEDKPFKCPVIGCDKMYKNQNGLKYHRAHGHQGQKLYENADGTFSIIDPESNQPYPDGMEFETDKPYRCDVCGKRYKNLNGLKYHRAHSTH